MTKILLVEDDKSLREIYGVRLLAEGYDIVSAGDGEEALAMTIKERPGLVITDIMMPRISGFDFADILRSTTETKDIKIIMMTALSSEEQRKHGERLGADRYLVKSQVGIEDVVRVVHEVLGDTPAATAPASPAAAPASTPTAQAPAPKPALPTPQPPATPVTPSAAPSSMPTPPIPPRPLSPPQARPTPTGLPQPAAPGQPIVSQPINPAAPSPPVPTPAVAQPIPPPLQNTTPTNASSRQRVIQPINDPTQKIDINNLLDKELAREAGIDMNNRPTVATTQEERAVMADQLRQVAPTVPPPAPVAAPPVQPPAPTAAPTPPLRPPVQAPPRPNVAPIQPRQDTTPPTSGV